MVVQCLKVSTVHAYSCGFNHQAEDEIAGFDWTSVYQCRANKYMPVHKCQTSLHMRCLHVEIKPPTGLQKMNRLLPAVHEH